MNPLAACRTTWNSVLGIKVADGSLPSHGFNVVLWGASHPRVATATLVFQWRTLAMSSKSNTTFPVKSKYTGPHMGTTNPVTGQPWTASQQAIVDQLNSLGKQYYDAIEDGNQTAANTILRQTDELLDSTPDDIQFAISLSALSAMRQSATGTF